jgi:hypothetical protein
MTMAAENEIQEFFEKLGELVGAGYNAAMRDGSIPAISREAVKDIRNTVNEFFFGRGERGAEPGAPLNPLFHDIVQARRSHESAPDSLAGTLPPSPADLVEREGSVHGQQQSMQGVSPVGLDLPTDVRADVQAIAATAKSSIQESPADIGREELGQLPTQDPPRHRIGPKV